MRGMFEVIIVGLILLGFLTSGWFLLTWGRRILSAKRNKRTPISNWALIDFVGFQALAFLVLGLALVNVHLHGVQPATGSFQAVSRVLTTALVDVACMIRALRWAYVVREARGVSVELEDAAPPS